MASVRVVRYPGTPTILDPVSGATENVTRIPDLVNALRLVSSETGPLYVVVAEDAPWCSSFYPNVLVTANVDGAIESMRKYGRIKVCSPLWRTLARDAYPFPNTHAHPRMILLSNVMRTHFQIRTLTHGNVPSYDSSFKHAETPMRFPCTLPTGRDPVPMDAQDWPNIRRAR